MFKKQNLFNEKNPITQWTLTSEEWDRYLCLEEGNVNELRNACLKFVFWYLLACVLGLDLLALLLRGPSQRFLIASLLVCLIPIGVYAAYSILSWLRYRRLAKGPFEVLVFQSGIRVGSVTEKWDKRASSLKILKAAQFLRIQWISSRGKYTVHHDVLVPLPANSSDVIQKIYDCIQLSPLQQ